MVGIDGRTGSGKTTLARQLCALTGASRLTTDDFLSWSDLESWWPRLEAEALGPLFAGRDARYQTRDWYGDENGLGVKEWKTTTWHPIIVFEGVTSTRQRVAARLTYRIWVEAPEDLRRERALARDGDYWRRHWDDWRVVESEFFTADGSRDRADLIVDGAASAGSALVVR